MMDKLTSLEVHRLARMWNKNIRTILDQQEIAEELGITKDKFLDSSPTFMIDGIKVGDNVTTNDGHDHKVIDIEPGNKFYPQKYHTKRVSPGGKTCRDLLFLDVIKLVNGKGR